MVNQEMREINLTRSEVLNIMRAISSVKVGFMDELRSNEISEDRKEIAAKSLEMWAALHSKIKSQLQDQDNN